MATAITNIVRVSGDISLERGGSEDAPLYVTGSLATTAPVGATEVTGTVNLDRGNSSATPLFITGSLSTTAPPVQNVTGSVAISETARVTGSVSLSQPVDLTRGTVAGTPLFVSGSVGIGGPVSALVSNQVSVTVSSSLPVTVSGQLSVSSSGGTLPVAIQSAPQLLVSVTSSLPIRDGNSGNPWQVTGSILVVNPLVKGTQGTVGLAVQDLIDSGRVAKMFVTSSVSGTLGENLVTLRALSDYALSGSGATSFVPTNGKRFRLQNFNASWATVTPSPGANYAVTLRLRVSSTGAVTAKSPSICSLTITAPVTGSKQGASGEVEFPDGVEFFGTQQFGVTQESNTTQAGFDVSLIGFEY